MRLISRKAVQINLKGQISKDREKAVAILEDGFETKTRSFVLIFVAEEFDVAGVAFGDEFFGFGEFLVDGAVGVL